MSKAVLVIDMPESCADCLFQQRARGGYFGGFPYCVVRACLIGEINKKQPNCPLRPLPENKPTKGAESIRSIDLRGRIDEALRESFRIGYNACLEEIGGDNG
ncbi:MAG: hypothetical protein IJV71_05795 [Lachnospiraceae bacterium]|nr:hypothetical protein [Lachnospiraceae bacterium]